MFSVVIPTWNRAGVLIRAIESVCRQGFDDWELIVVDDASDNQQEVCQLVGGIPDTRVRLIACKKNRGGSHARNLGIKETTGKWILLLDSDDYFLPEKMRTLYDYIQQLNNPEVAFLYSRFVIKRRSA